jgi:hypothetical protein
MEEVTAEWGQLVGDAVLSGTSKHNGSKYGSYVWDYLNLGNRWSKATHAKVVGRMDDEFAAFVASGCKQTLDEWEVFYLQRHPKALDVATDMLHDKIKAMKEALDKVGKAQCRQFVTDLVLEQTFEGQSVQRMLVQKVADCTGQMCTFDATTNGVDGHIGGEKVTVKPFTYFQQSPEEKRDALPSRLIVYVLRKHISKTPVWLLDELCGVHGITPKGTKQEKFDELAKSDVLWWTSTPAQMWQKVDKRRKKTH